MNNANQLPNEKFVNLASIVKRYDATIALNNTDLDIYQGEVLGLIGPNGAGKSTMMGILAGVTPADDGVITIAGVDIPVKEYNSALAKKNGIACAWQEFSLCANLTVYENFGITVLDHSLFEKFGWRKKLILLAQNVLNRIFPNNGIDVSEKISHLSIEQRQMVEISCAASISNLKMLILDEPTSSLPNSRIEQLHNAVRELRHSGVTVIYISHKLEEIVRISTRIVVMRNGETTWTGATENVTTAQLIDLMGGRSTTGQISDRSVSNETSMLEISNLSTPILKNINLHVRPGEVVGISGLGGSGQRELLHEIYNASLNKKKCIRFTGTASFVSGDRQNEGVFHLWSIADNILISSLRQLTNWKLLNKKRENELAQFWYDKLKFKAEGKDAPITSLSGGNQQKAIIGRGLASGADIILFDDPTRGVDIETKEEIYKVLNEIRKEGKSVIWYSTEDNEMLQCDRVYIMQNGTITHELVGDAISVDNIVATSFHEDIASEEISSKKKYIATHNGIRRIFVSGSTISCLILALIWVVISFLNDNANTRTGLTYMIGSALPLVFIAIAQMFIVLAGDINMGIGNAMGLVNVLTGTYLVTSPGFGVLSCAIFLLIYVGTAVLIHKRNMPAIVVSLGMSSIWLGIALVILPTPGGSGLEWLNTFLKLDAPLFPMQIYICIVAMLLVYWLLLKTKYGMVMRGIGSNPTAIIRRGWSYFMAHISLYALSGVFVLLAGLSLTGVSRGADPNGASSYQMQSIATILLGGCAFSGGIVEPVGVVAGALSISLISSMLTFMQVSSNYRTAVIGIILLLALAGGELLKRRRVR